MYGSARRSISMRRQHARVRAARLERVLQRQRVDDRRQHAHVVGVRAVHAARAGGDAAEDVAAADHQRDLDAQAVDVDDLVGDLRQRRRVDAVVWPEPIRASPESLSRMRRYFTPGASGSLVAGVGGAATGAASREAAARRRRRRSRRPCAVAVLALLLGHRSSWRFWLDSTPGQPASAPRRRSRRRASRGPRRPRSGRSGGCLTFSPVLATRSVSSARMSFLPSGSFTQT